MCRGILENLLHVELANLWPVKLQSAPTSTAAPILLSKLTCVTTGRAGSAP